MYGPLLIDRCSLFQASSLFPAFLPDYALNYLKWNPVLHLIEWVRSAYYPNYDSRVLDCGFVLTLSFAFIVMGLVGERILRHKKD